MNLVAGIVAVVLINHMLISRCRLSNTRIINEGQTTMRPRRWKHKGKKHMRKDNHPPKGNLRVSPKGVTVWQVWQKKKWLRPKS